MSRTDVLSGHRAPYCRSEMGIQAAIMKKVAATVATGINGNYASLRLLI